jgi:hypothetical protein
MAEAPIETLLLLEFPAEIVTNVTTSYRHIEEHYRLENWKTSELDAGHFVESVRRLLEFKLFAAYTPFSASIGSFNTQALSKYESAVGLDEYRILIPRVLYAMYCIRNKRGVGHISSISPNKLDATFILHSSKWVLAELIRLSGTTCIDEARHMVDYVLERHIDLIWDDGETFMVLDNKLRANEKFLLVLYKQDRLSVDEVRKRIAYKNKSAFGKIADDLQKEKLIAITAEGICKLSPLGVKRIEELIRQKSG